jgi:hypothetical protein
MPYSENSQYQAPEGSGQPGEVWDPTTGTWRPAGQTNRGEKTFNPLTYGGHGDEYDPVTHTVIAHTSTADRDAARYRSMAGQTQDAPVIDQAASNESRGIQMGSLGILENAANGSTVSPAAQLGYAQGRMAQNSAASMAASTRGGPTARAAASRFVGQNMGANQARTNLGASAAQANAMATARGQYMDATTGMRGQDLGLATDQAKLEAQQRALGAQHEQAYEQLGWQTKNAQLNANLGNTAAEANAANASRAASIAEDQANWGRVTDAGSMVAGGATGAVTGYAKQDEKSQQQPKPGATVSDKRAKTGIRPVSDKEAKRLSDNARGMLAGYQAMLAPASDKGDAPSKPSYDGKYMSLGAYASEPDAVSGADKRATPMSTTALHGAIEQQIAKDDAEAPRYGYFDEDEGGSKRPLSTREDPYAAPTRAPSGLSTRSDPYGDDVMMSDAHAKREAYLLGRAHQQEQVTSGKQVDWAYGGRPKADEDIVDKDPAKATEGKPREMQTFTREARPVQPTSRFEQFATSIVQPKGPQMPEVGIGPMTGLRAAQGIGTAVNASVDGYRAALADAPPPTTMRAQTTSDERAKQDVRGEGAMASANRAMRPRIYEYKPGFAEREGQSQGEKNVGPMAQDMAADPVASVAIVKDPKTGLLGIDKDKGLKLVMGGLSDLQAQVDQMKKRKA